MEQEHKGSPQSQEQQLRDKATADALFMQQHNEWLQHPHTKKFIELLDNLGLSLQKELHNRGSRTTESELRFMLGALSHNTVIIEKILNLPTLNKLNETI